MNELQAAQEELLAAQAAGNPAWVLEVQAKISAAEAAEAQKFSELVKNPEVQKMISELDELGAMIKNKGGDFELEKIQSDLKQDLATRFGYDYKEKLAAGGAVPVAEETENDFFPLL